MPQQDFQFVTVCFSAKIIPLDRKREHLSKARSDGLIIAK